MTRKRCPVCWRPIGITRWGHLAAHRDSIGKDLCPASGEPDSIGDEVRPLMAEAM